MNVAVYVKLGRTYTCVVPVSSKETWCYCQIAFDERVTFWLHLARVLPCACVFACGYTQAYVQIMQHKLMYKAVTGYVEAKKLLSCQRQSNYNIKKVQSKCWHACRDVV